MSALEEIKNGEDFFAGYSKPINRELMRVYRDLELVEYLGSGLDRILGAYNKNIFYFQTMEEDNEGVKSLLDFITQNPNKRTTQISNELNIPVKTLERQLKQLKDEQKIEFRGSLKTGGYFPLQEMH